MCSPRPRHSPPDPLNLKQKTFLTSRHKSVHNPLNFLNGTGTTTGVPDLDCLPEPNLERHAWSELSLLAETPLERRGVLAESMVVLMVCTTNTTAHGKSLQP